MICSYCHQARNETAAPCAHCGAPAVEQVQNRGQAGPENWGAQYAEQSSFNAAPPVYGTNNWAIQESPQNQWNGQPEQQNWNMSPQVEQPSWGIQPQDQQQNWNMSPQVEQPSWGIPPQDQQWGWSIPPEEQKDWQTPQPAQSWNIPQQLPPETPQAQPVQPLQPAQANPQMGLVPYQGGMEVQAASSRTSMLQILPNDLAEKMLPAIPQEEMAVYIPPMYTQPRAIIPRYRAISGLLSILLVTILLCTGASYAAKATGTLNTLTRFVTGDSHPPSIQRQPTSDLPEPKTLIETGPAFGTIYSATTTSHVDSVGLPVLPEHIFKVNQIIHLTYAVQSAKAGTVQIQWFSNGNPLADPISPPFDPKDGQNKHADATIAYALPAEGWVELKWNNKLAMRLYFVVRA
jgi:hypothetical protein